LQDLTTLAKDFPGTTIIIDHIAQPIGIGEYDKDKTMKEWKEGIEKISKFPNVYMKLSGMGMCALGFGLNKRA